MSAKRNAPPPLICLNCGDEVVIVAKYLPTGPLCADCDDGTLEPATAPTTTKPNEDDVPSARDIPAAGPLPESKGGPVDKASGDRAASPSMDPRSFWPARGAQGLVIEVEEWVYSFDQVLLLTPTDFMATIAFPPCERRYSRFVVILEWSLFADGPTMRDIGPSFGALTDRQAALGEATTFARAEARRLKCHGPFGYKPARSFEV